jgi:hypothetical protein
MKKTKAYCDGNKLGPKLRRRIPAKVLKAVIEHCEARKDNPLDRAYQAGKKLASMKV